MVIINPVRATLMKYKNVDRFNLPNVNDTCFGICAAFSQNMNTLEVDPKCAQACETLVEAKKQNLFGHASCEKGVPHRPVVWNQVPHYVPELYRKGESKEGSLAQCKKLCEANSVLVKECKEACMTDYNAIVESPKVSLSDLKEKAKNNMWIWIVGVLVLLLAIALVWYKMK